MSKALVLGAAALVFSAASASAQDDFGYDEPVADLAAPADGYAAPLAPPVYTTPPPVYAAPVYPAPLVAPPVYYAAPVYTPPPTVYVVPAPVYAAPVVPGYHPAPVGSRPIYAYAPGYWGGYGHGWRGHGREYGWR
jgi:hypothetical protein